MGLISINGTNPFEGQSDPYVTASTTVDQKLVTNTFNLDGQLTGCDLQDLFDLRDGLKDSFDWKEDPELVNKIVIDGVATATEDNPLVPTSLTFANSSYKGSVSYALTIIQVTGNSKNDDDDIDLIEKSWTETVDEDEEGCTRTTVSMSATAASNIPSGCTGAALNAANDWIKNNLETPGGQKKITNTLTSETLDSESLTINPITQGVQYTSVKSSNCKNQEDANAPEDEEGLQFTHCTEETTEYTKCEKGYNIVTTKHNGEAYKKTGTWEEISEAVNDKLFSNYSGIQDFNGSLNPQGSFTYSFTTQKDGDGELIIPPKNQVINDVTTSNSKTYNGGSNEKELSCSKSINGKIFYLFPTGDSVINQPGYSEADLRDVNIDVGNRLTAWSFSHNPEDNTASYSATINSIPDNEDPSETPSLNGFSGVVDISVSYTPSLMVYDLVPNMNCDDLVFEQGYVSRGATTISISATSGSGYDFLEASRDCLDEIKNFLITDQTSLRVTEEKEMISEDQKSVTLSYSSTFKGTNALTSEGNQIDSMI